MSNPSVHARWRSATVVTALCVLAGIGLSSVAQATSPTTKYSPVTTLQPTPMDNGLDAVSCAQPGDCAATGVDNIATEPTTIVGVETNGVWAAATQITFSTAIQSETPSSYPYAISCSAVGDCVVVGRYASKAGDGAFTDTSTHGVWAVAQPVVFANGVQGSSGQAQLNSVACPTTGNCTAVGEFTDATGGLEAMTVRSVGGIWDPAVPATFAPGTEDATPDATFSNVSCPTAGSCTAVGVFANTSGGHEAMMDSSTNGVWSNAVAVNLAPSDQSTAPASYFSSVSCAKVGDCTGVGFFLDTNGHLQAMTESSSDGTWAAAVPATLAAIDGVGDLYQLSAVVSCPAVSTCVVAGTYLNQSATQAFTLTEDAGTWGTAAAVTTDAAGSSPTTVNAYYGLSCPTVEYCVAVGSFAGQLGREAMTDVYTVANGVGSWADAVPATASFTNPTSSYVAGLYAVSCATAGNCTTVGTVNTTNSNIAMVETLSTSFAPPSPPLHVATSKVGTRSVVVSWRAPASNGGAPIVSYRVTASPGGAHCTTTNAVKCALKGLRAKTTYTVRVTAANATTTGATSKPLRFKTA